MCARFRGGITISGTNNTQTRGLWLQLSLLQEQVLAGIYLAASSQRRRSQSTEEVQRRSTRHRARGVIFCLVMTR